VEENEIPRMDAVLERIEGAIPHEAQPAARRPMVAIYILWHTLMGPDHYRPDAAPFMERYQSDLDAPSMEGFVVRVLTDQEIEWLDADLVALVNERREDQRRGRGQPLPAIFDVALLLCLGQRLWDKQPQEALSLISEAVELVPGTDELIELERAAKEGDKPAVDLRDLVIASQKARSEDSDIATSGEAANDRQERAETTPQKTRATTENNAQ
jgi:hypothetical protein